MKKPNATNFGPTEAQLEAMRLLTTEQRKQLAAGKEVTASNGVTFAPAGKPVTVAGMTVGVVKTVRFEDDRTVRFVRTELNDRYAALVEVMKRNRLPQEVRQEFRRFSDALTEFLALMGAAIEARNTRLDRAIELAGAIPAAVTSTAASARARAKHKNSPKRTAKEGALELWKERHAGKRPDLRRVQDFATEVMRRWPVLTNAKTIEGWSAKWSKEAKAGKNPTC